jgi:hypothetical protein
LDSKCATAKGTASEGCVHFPTSSCTLACPVMHRCLSIADIVGEVCSHVRECFPRNQAEATLATLARTSSVFHNPALDQLWHSQDTLENFFRCLPPDLVAFDEDNAGTGQKREVVAVRQITMSQIINSYAVFSCSDCFDPLFRQTGTGVVFTPIVSGNYTSSTTLCHCPRYSRS